jgi:hypothetical protein
MARPHSSFDVEEIRTMNDSPLTRRAWIARMATTALGGVALTALRPDAATAAPKPTSITVYKDPSCGCCTKWVDHLRANGFAPAVHDRSDMDALKDSLGVPAKLRSCHTAIVGAYVIEGHVPAADVKRLLTSKPAKTVGVAVPGMPAGSPGMEMGGRVDRYDVVAFAPGGATRVFASH